ncbi:MAG: hypothetical protein R3E09_04190 [Novosphingobium sp.]
MDGLEYDVVPHAVLEGLGKHFGRAVGRENIETGLQQLDGMEAGSGGDVQDRFLAAGLQDIDEKAAFAFGPLLPIDKFIPLFDKSTDIFGDIFISIPDRNRI